MNGCCCPPASVTERNNQSNVSEKQTGKELEKTYKINETFNHGDFRYTITGVTDTNVIGSEYNSEHASEGAKFLIVNFTEENLSNETKTVYSERFSLLDNKGREFRVSSKGSTALMFSSKDKDFLLSEIQPGIKHKSAVVFEVPEEAGGFMVKIPGGWGEKEVLVKL